MTKLAMVALVSFVTTGCATLTSDAMTPIAMSFGDGSIGTCELTNKRGAWSVSIPTTASVRRSDDSLRYQCKTEDGRESSGMIASTVGAKIVASAIFIDFGITDAITDKHREYAASFTIPVEARGPSAEGLEADSADPYAKLRELDELRQKGVITDAEFEVEKQKVLNSTYE